MARYLGPKVKLSRRVGVPISDTPKHTAKRQLTAPGVHGYRGKRLRERLRIFERICEAVAFAHDRGIIHRDLKPGNVMVGRFGEVLVMDWGVAKILADSSEEGDGAADTPSTPEVPPVPRLVPMVRSTIFT